MKGEGNSWNYKYRMHDARIGRFFAVDPLAPEYPHNSPYAFSENKVIAWVELEGLEASGGEQNSTETETPLTNELMKNPFVKESPLKIGMNGGNEAPAFSLTLGGTPSFNHNVGEPPLMFLLYGDRKYEFYNTSFKGTHEGAVFKPDEPNNYIQAQGRIKGNLEWSIFYNKQKNQPLSNGFKQEANSAIEFGIAKHKTFFKSEFGNFSYDVSLTAGFSFAAFQFQDINEGVSVTPHKFGVQLGGSDRYEISGGSATVIGRLEFTTLRMITVFISANYHHFQGRSDGTDTGIGNQRFGYIGSAAINIGTVISAGGRKQR